ncbi:hypothetical protein P170DRAFT_93904 [Aspergillus steynii IBT 23096]|uniref:Uncharacterized protein n=1 Tax=Aspergillus steynii IBT 23096 TaxID=1392250 RepID=A0A2I2GGC3_9EURO|nr:uncharacterized protein P170DRAFT_93904 [Aspergillus steynii IBT 23096]PLB51933.1 hypothetical protein P170DRAFT_93904 [Aspergillus steynii IBT 23096]
MPENCFSLGLSVLPARGSFHFPEEDRYHLPSASLQTCGYGFYCFLYPSLFFEVNAAIVFPSLCMSFVLDETAVLAISWGRFKKASHVASRGRLMRPFRGLSTRQKKAVRSTRAPSSIGLNTRSHIQCDPILTHDYPDQHIATVELRRQPGQITARRLLRWFL